MQVSVRVQNSYKGAISILWDIVYNLTNTHILTNECPSLYNIVIILVFYVLISLNYMTTCISR